MSESGARIAIAVEGGGLRFTSMSKEDKGFFPHKGLSDARRPQHHSPRAHPQARRVGGHTGAEAVSPPCEPPELDWGERRVALKTGDYTVMGMENLLALERKNLADLVACTVTYRRPFLAACGRLARFRWKAILIEATYEDIKGGIRVFWYSLCGPSQCRMRPRGRDRSKVRYPVHLRLDRAGSGDGARRELALEALHLLVVGAAGPRSGADRLGPIVIAVEGVMRLVD